MWRTGWWAAGILLVLCVGMLTLARHVAYPRVSRWRRHVVEWLVLATIIGAGVASLFLAVARIVVLRADLGTDAANLIGGSAAAGLMMFSFYLLAAAGLLAPSYAIMLVLVARFGPLLGWLESRWAGITLMTAALAAPAGIATAVFASSSWSPTGYSGAMLIRLSGYIFAVTWVALLLARRLSPRLSPGTFSG